MTQVQFDADPSRKDLSEFYDWVGNPIRALFDGREKGAWERSYLSHYKSVKREPVGRLWDEGRRIRWCD